MFARTGGLPSVVVQLHPRHEFTAPDDATRTSPGIARRTSHGCAQLRRLHWLPGAIAIR